MRFLIILLLSFGTFEQCLSASSIKIILDKKLTYLYFSTVINESEEPDNDFNKDFDLMSYDFFRKNLKDINYDSSVFKSHKYHTYINEFWNANKSNIYNTLTEIEKNYESLLDATNKIAQVLGVNLNQTMEVILIPISKKESLIRAELLDSKIIIPFNVREDYNKITFILILHEIVHLILNKNETEDKLFKKYITRTAGEETLVVREFFSEILATTLSNSCTQLLKTTGKSNAQWYNIPIVDQVSKSLAAKSRKYMRSNKNLDQEYFDKFKTLISRKEKTLRHNFYNRVKSINLYSYGFENIALDSIVYQKLNKKFNRLRFRFFRNQKEDSISERHLISNNVDKVLFFDSHNVSKIESVLKWLNVPEDVKIEVLSPNFRRFYHKSTNSNIFIYTGNPAHLESENQLVYYLSRNNFKNEISSN